MLEIDRFRVFRKQPSEFRRIQKPEQIGKIDSRGAVTQNVSRPVRQIEVNEIVRTKLLQIYVFKPQTSDSRIRLVQDLITRAQCSLVSQRRAQMDPYTLGAGEVETTT